MDYDGLEYFGSGVVEYFVGATYMMRKLRWIAVLLASLLLLSGCGSETYISQKESQVFPLMKEYRNGNYSYVVDLKTSVVYISYMYYNLGGLTVCLKADGTPMLASDLGLE